MGKWTKYLGFLCRWKFSEENYGEHVLFMAFAWWFSTNFLETKFNFDPDAIKTSEIPFPTAPDNAIYFQSHKQDTIIPKNPDLIFDSQTAHKENFHFQIITNIQILLFAPKKKAEKNNFLLKSHQNSAYTI